MKKWQNSFEISFRINLYQFEYKQFKMNYLAHYLLGAFEVDFLRRQQMHFSAGHNYQTEFAIFEEHYEINYILLKICLAKSECFYISNIIYKKTKIYLLLYCALPLLVMFYILSNRWILQMFNIFQELIECMIIWDISISLCFWSAMVGSDLSWNIFPFFMGQIADNILN